MRTDRSDLYAWVQLGFSRQRPIVHVCADVSYKCHWCHQGNNPVTFKYRTSIQRQRCYRLFLAWTYCAATHLEQNDQVLLKKRLSILLYVGSIKNDVAKQRLVGHHCDYMWRYNVVQAIQSNQGSKAELIMV